MQEPLPLFIPRIVTDSGSVRRHGLVLALLEIGVVGTCHELGPFQGAPVTAEQQARVQWRHWSYGRDAPSIPRCNEPYDTGERSSASH